MSRPASFPSDGPHVAPVHRADVLPRQRRGRGSRAPAGPKRTADAAGVDEDTGLAVPVVWRSH